MANSTYKLSTFSVGNYVDILVKSAAKAHYV